MSEEVSALDLLKQQLEYLAENMKKPSHLKMAQALADGQTQAAAYKASGGKGKDPYKCGNDLIRINPDIQQYADLAVKIASIEAQDELVGTLDQKRRALWDITQRCMTEVEPKYVGHGEEKELVGYVFDSRGAIGAIAELNKMDGDLAAIKTDNKHTHEYEDLSDEDLDREIAERTGAKPS
ncbi:hypothetical protein [Gilvimarinus chinensis]|uniref:hypothetical protein n=1 Tax=Gilvimarinus chinensis TaxID=396005 RepID=UPI000374AD86|nr:hypothetical protein [Gilvimarinus chinensis]